MGMGTNWVGLALPAHRSLQRALVGKMESLGMLGATAGFGKELNIQGDKK